MEQQPERHILTAKQLAYFPDYQHYSHRHLRRKYENIMEFVDKRPGQELTVKDFAEWLGFSEQRLREILIWPYDGKATNGPKRT